MKDRRPVQRGDAVRSKSNGTVIGTALHDEDDSSLRSWEKGIVHIKANMGGEVFACAVDDLEFID